MEKYSMKSGKNLVLTHSQQKVFSRFIDFTRNNSEKVFILRGYAGTGKTTMIRFFISKLKELEKHCTLMASTGRAAKIVSNATDSKASTVHSVIYSFKDFNQDIEKIVEQEERTGIDKSGQLFLTFELVPVKSSSNKERFYIIDEASMISDVKDPSATQAVFGSGKLLSDLLSFDKNGKFIFVGDESQLPPVGQEISPALSSGYLTTKSGVTVVDVSLTEIVRQQQGNSIILASHRIRQMYASPPQEKWAKLPLGNYEHISLYPNLIDMINNYIKIIRNRNYNKAAFIAYSNAKCNSLNNLIRSALGINGTLQPGDLLLVTQNNLISGFMNGDMVVVEQIKEARYQRAELTFQLVEVRELVTGRRFSQLMIEDILYGNTTNLGQHQQKSLFIDFFKRMRAKGINQKNPLFKERLNDDPYLNALRCVFGYAITCHKAQGGEWDEVFVDLPRNITLNAKPASYQWVYTAVTRAKERLHVVKDFFIE